MRLREGHSRCLRSYSDSRPMELSGGGMGVFFENKEQGALIFSGTRAM